ncbi:hypothetical protein MPER_10306 [Moniliophthora perniciosa FA553]|nr:hypothetical protein MPER_10306 [Moniliophthora perniciosa FA553]
MSDIDASQPDSLTERSRGNRKIKHHEFTGDDLAQLIEGNRKLSSSIVNAYAAQLQIDAEDEGLSPEWCVFSSYLGPLVLGELNEGPGHGYIAQHILGAVSLVPFQGVQI